MSGEIWTSLTMGICEKFTIINSSLLVNLVKWYLGVQISLNIHKALPQLLNMEEPGQVNHEQGTYVLMEEEEEGEEE